MFHDINAAKSHLREDCVREDRRWILTPPLPAVAGFEVFRSGRFGVFGDNCSHLFRCGDDSTAQITLKKEPHPQIAVTHRYLSITMRHTHPVLTLRDHDAPGVLPGSRRL